MQATQPKRQTAPATPARNAFFEGLAAPGRSRDIAPEDDVYGWLVGSWSLVVTAHDPAGRVTETKGEAHVAWVLEGRAIQDVFINPTRTERGPTSPSFGNWYGITFRFYDPTIRAWRAHWFNPHDGIRAELIARREGDELVQEGQFPDGTRIRWTYSEIRADSCYWRGERLDPDGETWRLQVEFRAQRLT